MERKRAFMTASEKVCLKQLMCKYKDILESKKTDCVSVAERKKTWCALSKDFNSLIENSSRTPDQLKKCWDNTKTRRKKELSEEKKQRIATGGGPYKPSTENDIDDLLNCVNIEIKSSIDSDTIALSKVAEGEYKLKKDQTLQLLENASINEEATVTTEDDVLDIREGENLPQVTANLRQEKNLRQVLTTPSHNKNKKSIEVGVTRANALERELQVRLERNDLLKMHEDEIHALRLVEHRLKIQQEEVKLKQEEIKLEEHIIKKRIAEEQLQQEVLKTTMLKQKCSIVE